MASAAGELRKFDLSTKQGMRSITAAVEQFSGQKIALEAEVMVRSVQMVGGVSKLTASELKHLSSVLDEAANKSQRLGNEVAPSIAKMRSEIERLPKPAGDGAASLGLIAGVAAAVATKALDAASALSRMAVDGIGQLITRGSRLSSLGEGFTALSGGATKATATLEAMQRGTRGLVADVDIMQASNKATLLGLGLNSEAMGDLANTAQVLGRAMGQDATKSLDDLITALGRSSPLILDNLGLSVKVGEANEKYAASLDKSVMALTDAEKKQAFMNAAMDAARARVSELGGGTLTLSDRWQQLTTRLTNAADALGATLGKSTELTAVLFTINNLLDDMSRKGGAAETTVGKLWQAWEQYIAVGRMVTPGLVAWNQFLEEQADAAEHAAFQLEAAAVAAQTFARLGNLNRISPALPGQATDPWKQLEVQEKADKEAKKRAEEAQKLAEEFKKAQDQLFGRDLIDRAKAFSAQLGTVNNVTKLSVEKKAELRKAVEAALDAYKRLGLIAPDALKKIEEATRPLITTTHQWAVVELKAAAQSLTPFASTVRSLGMDAVPMLSASIDKSRLGFVELKKTVDDNQLGLESINRVVTTFVDTFTASLIDSIASIPGTLLDAVAKGDFKNALKSIGFQIADTLIAGMGNMIADAIAKQLTSKAIAQGVSGVGAGAAGVGAAGAGAAGMSAATASGLAFFAMGAMIAYNGQQNVKAMREARKAMMAELAELGKQVEDAQKAMWAAGMGGADWLGKNIGPVGLEGQIEHYRSLLTELARRTALMKDLEDQIAAAEAGMLELHEQGKYTLQEMKADAQTLGIEFSRLGGVFKMAEIDDTAQRYTQALERMIKVSGDPGHILFESREAINQLVQDAKKLGVALPENMQPWLEEMLRAGLLVDENGEALKDLSGIRFGARLKTEAEMIQEAMDKLVETVERLTAALLEIRFPSLPSLPTVPGGGGETGVGGGSEAAGLAAGFSRADSRAFLRSVGNSVVSAPLTIEMDKRVVAEGVIEVVGNRIALKTR
jgi:hypothetical protein